VISVQPGQDHAARTVQLKCNIIINNKSIHSTVYSSHPSSLIYLNISYSSQFIFLVFYCNSRLRLCQPGCL